MKFSTCLIYCEEICKLSGVPHEAPHQLQDYKHYLENIAYLARQLPQAQRPRLYKDFSETLSRLYGEFSNTLSRDPMSLYIPQNPTSMDFHKSNAYVRYFRAGNRTSKTQSGYAEHYFCVTGSHPYRQLDRPASTLLVAGLPFTDYAPKVFSKKMLYGEDSKENNILAPIFPEGGKWFNHYNEREHTLTIACVECAEAGRAQSCPSHHPKVTISLVSSEKGKGVLEGFSVRLAHGDEHLPDGFYQAMAMRVGDQKGGGLIFTGTPLHGPEAWEAEYLTKIAEGPEKQNKKDPEDPDSVPMVSLHWCSKFDGGIVPANVIRAEMQTMSEFENEARIYGRPAPLAKHPVFDHAILAEMRRNSRFPELGILKCPVELIEAQESTPIEFSEHQTGPVRVWEKPILGEQYIVGVDTAAGLAKSRRDASCASVLKMSSKNNKVQFELVAQFHSWIGIHDYADEVFKLALWYNSAMVIIELTGGLGRAVLERLRKDLFYWNIFRETGRADLADFHPESRLGVETSPYSKAGMVAIAQQLLHSDRLIVPCRDTIAELAAYEQEKTDHGNTKYRGSDGSHDDRVMSIVIGVSAAINNSLYNSEGENKEATSEKEEEWKRIRKSLTTGDNIW